MLVPLFLWQCGLIGQPMFYVSAYSRPVAMRPGNGRRGTILVFPDLLNIAEGRDVF